MSGSEVLIQLVKENHVSWPRLTQTKEKLSFIAVDFDRWNDSSSEDEKGTVHYLLLNGNERWENINTIMDRERV